MTAMWNCIRVKVSGCIQLYFDFYLQPFIFVVVPYLPSPLPFLFTHYLSAFQSLLYLSLSHMPLLPLHFRTCCLHFLNFLSLCYFALCLTSLSHECLRIHSLISSCISVFCLFVAVIFPFFFSQICFFLVSVANYSTHFLCCISQVCCY